MREKSDQLSLFLDRSNGSKRAIWLSQWSLMLEVMKLWFLPWLSHDIMISGDKTELDHDNYDTHTVKIGVIFT